jgi:hypothetical protein
MSRDLRTWRGRRFVLDDRAYPALRGKVLHVIDAKVPRGSATTFVAAVVGSTLQWFHERDLLPAPATAEQRQEVHMSHETQLINLAATIAAKNSSLSYADAMKQAGQQLGPVVQAWRESIRDDGHGPPKPATSGAGPVTIALAVRVQAKTTQGVDQQAALESALAEMVAAGTVTSTPTMADASPRKPVALSLSSIVAKPAETFDAFALRIADERGIPLRDAAHLAGLARPDLAAARG